MDIQLAPYCDDFITEKQENGQFYVGTDQQILNILGVYILGQNNLIPLSHFKQFFKIDNSFSNVEEGPSLTFCSNIFTKKILF